MKVNFAGTETTLLLIFSCFCTLLVITIPCIIIGVFVDHVTPGESVRIVWQDVIMPQLRGDENG